MKIHTLAHRGFALLALPALATAQIQLSGSTTYPLAGPRPDGAAVGDFDGANGPDFAVTTSPQGGGVDRLEVFQNQGNGSFLAGQVLVLGNNVDPGSPVAVDFDGDLDVDLAVGMKNLGTVQLLVNNGGVFSMGASVATGGLEPQHMTTGDFDGDGDVDLVTSNRDSNNMTLLENQGAGTFVSAGLLSTGTDPRYLVLADLNGDCELDLAVAAHDSRRVEVRFNLGGGVFGAPTLLSVPLDNKPSGMAAADLDADGDLDLVTTTDQNDVGQACVYTNNGGTFSAVCFNSGGINPSAVIVADLDADGDKDLAVVDEDANVVSALSGLGTNIFVAAGSFGVGAHPTDLQAADFDGNGSIDLVAPNRDSNNVSVLLNVGVAGAHNFCTGSPNSVGAGASIDSFGSLSITAGAFTLTARCAPANEPGIFYFGDEPRNFAFGDGRRCAGGTTVRLNPPAMIDSTGRALRLVDFSNPAGLQIPVGAERFFQFWYRDPAGGGSGFNLTDGLSVTFLP